MAAPQAQHPEVGRLLNLRPTISVGVHPLSEKMFNQVPENIRPVKRRASTVGISLFNTLEFLHQLHDKAAFIQRPLPVHAINANKNPLTVPLPKPQLPLKTKPLYPSAKSTTLNPSTVVSALPQL